MVSDLETILIDNKHRPYAGGVMLVHPGDDVKECLIYTYFSEDYSGYIESFEERSKKVLFDLVFKIIALVKKDKTAKTVYFHNFSRFDGILVLKHLACHHDFKLKPLFRNNRLYELSVYSDRKLLFRLRDSLNLLPGTLNNLAKSLCPTLGCKGSIDQLISYMKQDILLLGGVMQKAQDIYYEQFQLDIVNKITLPSVALSMYGFIEAYVVCPQTIIFTTGEFVGVYYSEELKFARDRGYTVLPLSGYLYETKESPFKEFVNSPSSSRIEAKKEGNDALSYVYKILMNSLYGRFGINPKSTTSEICDSFIYGSGMIPLYTVHSLTRTNT